MASRKLISLSLALSLSGCATYRPNWRTRTLYAVTGRSDTMHNISPAVNTPPPENPPERFLSLFNEGKENFRRFRFADCDSTMIKASTYPASPELRAQVTFYAGVCNFYLGRRTEAERLFEYASRTFPLFYPDTEIFTPEIINLYKKISTRRTAP